MGTRHEDDEQCWPVRVEHATARDILIEYVAGASSHALASLYSFAAKKTAEILIDGKSVCRYVNGTVWWELETHDALRLKALHSAAPDLLSGLKAAVESLVELAQHEEAARGMVATGWFDDAVKAIANAEGRGE